MYKQSDRKNTAALSCLFVINASQGLPVNHRGFLNR